jgi:hypothetical protein
MCYHLKVAPRSLTIGDVRRPRDAAWPTILLAAALLVAGAGCSPAATACKTAKDCGEGWSCAESVCRKLCNHNDECWPPEIGCVDGVCQPVPTTGCGSITDCLGMPTVDGCSEQGICVCQALGLPCLAGELCTPGGCFAPSSGPTSIGLSAGGLDGTSVNYRLQLFVAPASPLGSGSSERFELRLGPARPTGR